MIRIISQLWRRRPHSTRMAAAVLAVTGTLCLFPAGTGGQEIFTFHGDPIPPGLEAMYQRGLTFLTTTQTESGCWLGQYGTEPAVVGLAVLAILAHGEDPNFGHYSASVRKGLDYILKSTNADSGYIGSSMYNHGFATLALAEAYGAVDDDRLGPALKKAVALILRAQASNQKGAWRYSPTSRDADTTVSGAQLVALIAARNAGIAVPDSAVKRALTFFRSCQGGSGGFGYTNAGSPSGPRSAIGTLIFALAGEKDSTAFRSAFKYLQQGASRPDSRPYYYMYYASQAFFHADMPAWRAWDLKNQKMLSSTQSRDGSWSGSNGPAFSTSAALLSCALNYRLLPIYER